MDLSADGSSRLSPLFFFLSSIFPWLAVAPWRYSWWNFKTLNALLQAMQEYAALGFVVVSHKSAGHWPMKHLSRPRFALKDPTPLQKRDPDGMAPRPLLPAADVQIKKKQKKTLVAACVTLLSWHFECYQLSFMLAQTQRASLRNPGEASVQNMQGQMEIHIGGLSLGEWKERRGINSPSSLHLSPTSTSSGLFLVTLSSLCFGLWLLRPFSRSSVYDL